jgi:DNA-binding NtrC family response regulator
MRRVVTLAGTSTLDSNCFEREFHGHDALQGPDQPSVKKDLPAGTPIWQVEKIHLEKTLALTEGNRTHAAEMLGISLRTMRNKIREYGLPPRRFA